DSLQRQIPAAGRQHSAGPHGGSMLTSQPYSLPASRPDRREAPHQNFGEADTQTAAGGRAEPGLLDSISRHAQQTSGFHRLPEGTPPLRILVVDDDASLRKACCEIAVGMGFNPLAAGSVPEALAMLQEQQPVELLLLDLKLPGGGGLN